MTRSESSTRSIRVSVRSMFLSERSSPAEGRWLFAYTVTIANEGQEPVQLLSRHWVITDADGEQEEVRGPGVVGQQPLMAPGETFEYTSYCPLGTSFGTMHGQYEMLAQSGDTFEVEIAPFSLNEPYAVN